MMQLLFVFVSKGLNMMIFHFIFHSVISGVSLKAFIVSGGRCVKLDKQPQVLSLDSVLFEDLWPCFKDLWHVA